MHAPLFPDLSFLLPLAAFFPSFVIFFFICLRSNGIWLFFLAAVAAVFFRRAGACVEAAGSQAVAPTNGGLVPPFVPGRLRTASWKPVKLASAGVCLPPVCRREACSLRLPCPLRASAVQGCRRPPRRRCSDVNFCTLAKRSKGARFPRRRLSANPRLLSGTGWSWQEVAEL